MKMRGRGTTILVAFAAGLIGGAIPRVLFPEHVALAQNPQEVLQKYKEIPTPATKVLRAERIELVNNRGKALAIFDVGYSEALPAGSPELTFTARDEAFHKDERVVLTPTQFSMYGGRDEWTRVGPGGGFTFRDATGGGGIGSIPLSAHPPTLGLGVNVWDSTGVMTLTSHGLLIGDKDGRPVVMLPQ